VFYKFQVYSDDSGYWGECRELPGCVSQGESKEALEENLREALNLYLEEPSDSNTPVAMPDSKQSAASDSLSIPVEPEIAVGVLLRNARKECRMTQRQVADSLGMKSLYSYQRLERRANPTLALLKRIKQVFPQISIDEMI